MVIVGFPEQWEAAEGAGYPEETEKLPREKALMTTLYLLYDFACESPCQEAQSSCSINLWVKHTNSFGHGFALAHCLFVIYAEW